MFTLYSYFPLADGNILEKDLFHPATLEQDGTELKGLLLVHRNEVNFIDLPRIDETTIISGCSAIGISCYFEINIVSNIVLLGAGGRRRFC